MFYEEVCTKKIIYIVIVFISTLLLQAESHTYLIENDAVFDTFRAQVQDPNMVILNSGFKLLGPGDRILFKSGEKFTGQLYAENQSGTSDKPIVIDSYSLDSAGNVIVGKGDKPVISHQVPEKSADSGYRALFFKNSQCWDISNIAVRNAGAGILFIYTNGKPFDHIYITNCEITDVTGTGIWIVNPGMDWNKDNQICKGNNITIKGNYVKNCGNTAISTNQSWNGEFTSWEENNRYKPYWFSNVSVTDNKIEDVSNNGIVIWGAESPVIKNNYLKHTGSGIISPPDKILGKGQSIFVSFTTNANISYNEVCDNEYTYYPSLNRGDGDAGGIGIDYFTYDTLCEYNYLHVNAQNGIAIMANFSPDQINKDIQNPRPVIRAIVRHNRCVNNSKTPDLFIEGTPQYKEANEDPDYPEGHINSKTMTDGEFALNWWKSRCGEIRISGPADDCLIYDNIFISSDKAYQMISEESWWGYPQNINWENNTFYSTNSPDIKFEYLGGGNKFINNKFNIELKDENWVTGITDWHPAKSMLVTDPEFYNTENIEHKIEKNGSEKWISPKPLIVK